MCRRIHNVCASWARRGVLVRYIGVGGEYGGGATGPGKAGVLTHLTGITLPGVIILTLTGKQVTCFLLHY